MKNVKIGAFAPYHYFTCPECDKEERIKPEDFASHVKDVHGITAATGLREMVMHVNRQPRHRSVFKWTIGGMAFYEYSG